MGVKGLLAYINSIEPTLLYDITQKSLQIAIDKIKALHTKRWRREGESLNFDFIYQSNSLDSFDVSLQQFISELPRVKILIDGNSMMHSFTRDIPFRLFNGELTQYYKAFDDIVGAMSEVCYILQTTRINSVSGESTIEQIRVPVADIHVCWDGDSEELKSDTLSSRFKDLFSVVAWTRLRFNVEDITNKFPSINSNSTFQELLDIIDKPDINDAIVATCHDAAMNMIPPKKVTPILRSVLSEVFQNRGCHQHISDTENDVQVFALARKLDADLILASDTDYYVTHGIDSTLVCNFDNIKVIGAGTVGAPFYQVCYDAETLAHLSGVSVEGNVEGEDRVPLSLLSRLQSKMVSPSTRTLLQQPDNALTALLSKDLSWLTRQSGLVSTEKSCDLLPEDKGILGGLCGCLTCYSLLNSQLKYLPPVSLLPSLSRNASTVSSLQALTKEIHETWATTVSPVHSHSGSQSISGVVVLGVVMGSSSQPFTPSDSQFVLASFHAPTHKHVVATSHNVQTLVKTVFKDMPSCMLPFLSSCVGNDFVLWSKLFQRLGREKPSYKPPVARYIKPLYESLLDDVVTNGKMYEAMKPSLQLMNYAITLEPSAYSRKRAVAVEIAVKHVLSVCASFNAKGKSFGYLMCKYLEQLLDIPGAKHRRPVKAVTHSHAAVASPGMTARYGFDVFGGYKNFSPTPTPTPTPDVTQVNTPTAVTQEVVEEKIMQVPSPEDEANVSPEVKNDSPVTKMLYDAYCGEHKLTLVPLHSLSGSSEPKCFSEVSELEQYLKSESAAYYGAEVKDFEYNAPAPKTHTLDSRPLAPSAPTSTLSLVEVLSLQPSCTPSTAVNASERWKYLDPSAELLLRSESAVFLSSSAGTQAWDYPCAEGGLMVSDYGDTGKMLKVSSQQGEKIHPVFGAISRNGLQPNANQSYNAHPPLCTWLKGSMYDETCKTYPSNFSIAVPKIKMVFIYFALRLQQFACKQKFNMDGIDGTVRVPSVAENTSRDKPLIMLTAGLSEKTRDFISESMENDETVFTNITASIVDRENQLHNTVQRNVETEVSDVASLSNMSVDSTLASYTFTQGNDSSREFLIDSKRTFALPLPQLLSILALASKCSVESFVETIGTDFDSLVANGLLCEADDGVFRTVLDLLTPAINVYRPSRMTPAYQGVLTLSGDEKVNVTAALELARNVELMRNDFHMAFYQQHYYKRAKALVVTSTQSLSMFAKCPLLSAGSLVGWVREKESILNDKHGSHWVVMLSTLLMVRDASVYLDAFSITDDKNAPDQLSNLASFDCPQANVSTTTNSRVRLMLLLETMLLNMVFHFALLALKTNNVDAKSLCAESGFVRPSVLKALFAYERERRQVDDGCVHSKASQVSKGLSRSSLGVLTYVAHVGYHDTSANNANAGGLFPLPSTTVWGENVSMMQMATQWVDEGLGLDSSSGDVLKPYCHKTLPNCHCCSSDFKYEADGGADAVVNVSSLMKFTWKWFYHLRAILNTNTHICVMNELDNLQHSVVADVPEASSASLTLDTCDIVSLVDQAEVSYQTLVGKLTPAPHTSVSVTATMANQLLFPQLNTKLLSSVFKTRSHRFQRSIVCHREPLLVQPLVSPLHSDRIVHSACATKSMNLDKGEPWIVRYNLRKDAYVCAVLDDLKNNWNQHSKHKQNGRPIPATVNRQMDICTCPCPSVTVDAALMPTLSDLQLK